MSIQTIETEPLDVAADADGTSDAPDPEAPGSDPVARARQVLAEHEAASIRDCSNAIAASLAQHALRLHVNLALDGDRVVASIVLLPAA